MQAQESLGVAFEHVTQELMEVVRQLELAKTTLENQAKRHHALQGSLVNQVAGGKSVEVETLELQVQQARDELAVYAAKCTELTQELQAMQRATQQQLPGFCYARQVQARNPVSTPEHRAVDIAFTHFRQGERYLPSLVVTLERAEGGATSLRISRAKNAATTLLCWANKQHPDLTLTAHALAGSAAAASMCTSDWKLLLGVANLLSHQLAPGATPTLFDNAADGELWHQGAALFNAWLHALPPVFRYDSIKLRQEFVQPDYAHLWPTFTNASWADRCHPQFNFKIGTKDIQRAGFGQRGVLEFRADKSLPRPLKDWPPRESDEYGPYFRPFFWDEHHLSWLPGMSAEDQAFVQALLEALPKMTSDLAHEITEPKHPWVQWISLGTTMLAYLAAGQEALSTDAP